ncbi:MAG: antitoxin [Caulobacter sp.]|nr:antitoxin [Caulobacter sp.]
MADGFDIHLDKDRAERVTQAAALAGLTPEAYVLSLVDENLDLWAGLAEPADGGWAEDMARLERYRRTGVAIPLKTAMDEIKAELDERLAGKR